VHVVEAKVPVLLVVNVTVPVGVVAPVAAVLTTVALQLVGVLSRTDEGEQLTVVAVPCTVTPTGRLNVPLLPTWTPSPPYDPVIK
jgi:hypothetical protein